MPLAPIGSDVALHYEDSGIPHGVADYTTVVIVHGLAFNGGIFEPMFPFAVTNSIRIIAVNMRDYRGSTPYTEAQLAEFMDKDIEVQARAVRRVAREMAAFLVFVSTELGVLPSVVKDGNKIGGIVLMTWSLSTMALMSMLGDPEVLNLDMKSALSPFLRKFILYDPPTLTFGVAAGDGLTHPFKDNAIPLTEKPAAFVKWVTAYYTPVSDETPRSITIDALRTREAHGAPTAETMSPCEIGRIIEPGVVLRSGAMLMTDPEMHRVNTQRAFFDAADTFAEASVVALWCDCSIWTSLLAAKYLDNVRGQSAGAAKVKRALSLVKIPDANHLYHWDQPENMVSILAQHT